MPLAGMFSKTRDQALKVPIFPLTWVECENCDLIQALEEIDDHTLFSKYTYASSAVGVLIQHFEQYKTFLTSRYLPIKALDFLEIGCNDGVLLNRLPSGWRLLGVDPSDVAKRAHRRESQYHLYNEHFSNAFVQKHHLENSTDVVSGSNSLAHISDLREIFLAVRLTLRKGGHFWLEVHDLKTLLTGYQWDTIYHEHKVEWSEESLIKCLLPLGFSHLETHRVPLHGGLLRMGFQKEIRPQSVPRMKHKIAGELAKLRNAYLHRRDNPVVKRLISETKKGRKIAAYGASGRANVYLNQLKEIPFDYVVDESPLRIGKFLPQVGTPVVTRQVFIRKPRENCLITAWNYRDDIIRKNPQYQGHWLTGF